MLKECKIDPNAQDIYGDTALHGGWERCKEMGWVEGCNTTARCNQMDAGTSTERKMGVNVAKLPVALKRSRAWVRK